MKKINFVALVGAVTLLAACQATVRPPEVEVETPGGVEIKVKNSGDSSSSSDGKFCPPGQAKKGNC